MELDICSPSKQDEINAEQVTCAQTTENDKVRGVHLWVKGQLANT